MDGGGGAVGGGLEGGQGRLVEGDLGHHLDLHADAVLAQQVAEGLAPQSFGKSECSYPAISASGWPAISALIHASAMSRLR